jgi:hypothetical protein
MSRDGMTPAERAAFVAALLRGVDAVECPALNHYTDTRKQETA